MPWNELANPPVGNPTKSILVDDLIKRVTKKEVRKQGKRSQALKRYTDQEYKFAINKIDSYGDDEVRLFVSSIFRLQMATIGRIDDASKLLSENLKENQKHSRYSILCKLCSSKIVNSIKIYIYFKWRQYLYPWEGPYCPLVYYLKLCQKMQMMSGMRLIRYCLELRTLLIVSRSQFPHDLSILLVRDI